MNKHTGNTNLTLRCKCGAVWKARNISEGYAKKISKTWSMVGHGENCEQQEQMKQGARHE